MHCCLLELGKTPNMKILLLVLATKPVKTTMMMSTMVDCLWGVLAGGQGKLPLSLIHSDTLLYIPTPMQTKGV